MIGILLALVLLSWWIRRMTNQRRERSLFEVDPNDASLRTCKRCGTKQRKVIPENLPYYDYYAWIPLQPYKAMTWVEGGRIKACRCVRYIGKPYAVLNKV